MEPTFRKLFNAAFTDRIYRDYVDGMSRKLGVKFNFRNAETPVFVPPRLLARLVDSANAILAQLSAPALIEKTKSYIPPRWNTPGLSEPTNFTMIDFAIVRQADGELVPRLIELQGFPSLTALQVYKRDGWMEQLATMPGLDRAWSCWPGGHTREQFLELARQTIVGSHDPEHVIMMDLDPPSQGTYPDFVATRQLFGVDAVCPSTLIKQGKSLLRKVEGHAAPVPVKRIYNRVVFDELARSTIQLPFDYRDELDVEWSPHPNWFFIWSKASMPFLDHPDAPRTLLVSEIAEPPADLDQYVLKPLFSFSGGGVVMTPTKADLDKLPADERRFWCLQRKVEYAPVVVNPAGEGIKCEIRMMYLKPPGVEKPILALNLARLARGLLIGTAFNKEFTWVGSTVALWPA